MITRVRVEIVDTSREQVDYCLLVAARQIKTEFGGEWAQDDTHVIPSVDGYWGYVVMKSENGT